MMTTTTGTIMPSFDCDDSATGCLLKRTLPFAAQAHPQAPDQQNDSDQLQVRLHRSEPTDRTGITQGDQHQLIAHRAAHREECYNTCDPTALGGPVIAVITR